MKSINSNKIVELCNGKLLTNKEAEIFTFSRDTRTMQKGDMYIELPSEKENSKKHFEEALENGAIGCIVEEDISEQVLKKYNDKIIIKVDSTIDSLQKIAEYKRSQYNIPVIMVTGSVGKTSTKDTIASVLSQKFNVLKTEGNQNNHIGLPLTLLKLDNQDIVVAEAGMNHFGEIRLLSKIAKPTVAVITNIGTSHIGNLGSRENILKAKLEILEGMPDEKTIVINNDNDLLNNWYKSKPCKNIITYGINSDSDYKAQDVVNENNKITYKARIDETLENIEVPVMGEHFVYNSLAAISVGKLFNVETAKIINGIRNIELTKNRMQIIEKADFTIINDAYNSSLDSTKPALNVLKNLQGKKEIAVLGDMLELGEYSKELHEEVGKEVVKNNIDILIVVGELSKNIAQTAEKLGMEKTEIFTCNNNSEAVEVLHSVIEKNSVVLLKASNAMKFGEILEKIEVFKID